MGQTVTTGRRGRREGVVDTTIAFVAAMDGESVRIGAKAFALDGQTVLARWSRVIELRIDYAEHIEVLYDDAMTETHRPEISTHRNRELRGGIALKEQIVGSGEVRTVYSDPDGIYRPEYMTSEGELVEVLYWAPGEQPKRLKLKGLNWKPEPKPEDLALDGLKAVAYTVGDGQHVLVTALRRDHSLFAEEAPMVEYGARGRHWHILHNGTLDIEVDVPKGSQINFECTGKTASVTLNGEKKAPVLANLLQFGDEPTAEERQTVPVYALNKSEDRTVPAVQRTITVTYQGRSESKVTDDNGRAEFNFFVPGKGMWVTFSCDGAVERRYLRGPRNRGILLLPPRGPRPDENAPWVHRALDALREGANNGLRYTDLPTNIPGWRANQPWLVSAAVVFPLLYIVTTALPVGWLLYFMTATALTTVCARWPERGWRAIGSTLLSFNNRRWLVGCAMAAFCLFAAWRLPPALEIGPSVTDRGRAAAQQHQLIEKFTNFSNGKGWVADSPPPQVGMPKPTRVHTPWWSGNHTSGSAIKRFFFWLIFLVLYAIPVFADDIRVAMEDRALARQQREHRRAVEEAYRKGETPPPPPPPPQKSWLESMSSIAVIFLIFEEVRELLTGGKHQHTKLVEALTRGGK
jgi:hypothetical protein